MLKFECLKNGEGIYSLSCSNRGTVCSVEPAKLLDRALVFFQQLSYIACLVFLVLKNGGCSLPSFNTNHTRSRLHYEANSSLLHCDDAGLIIAQYDEQELHFSKIHVRHLNRFL